MMTTNKYFRFLCNIVVINWNYEHLLRQLHSIEFYSLVPNDDNRAEDGKKLREIFLNESGNIATSSLSIFHDKPCSVLEMLIGLSYRMENELEGGSSPLTAKQCFWVLLENLNLHWCGNQQYLEDEGKEWTDFVIRRFLDRHYDINGDGGLFPLVRTNKDQRKVEIWYQMCEYLLENYEF